MSEPNTLTNEQNELLNSQAREIFRLIGKNVGTTTTTGKALLVAMILLAYSTDEEWLRANEACESMISEQYQGSIVDAVLKFMPRHNDNV